MTPSEFKAARETYPYVPARLVRAGEGEDADLTCFGLRLRKYVPEEWQARLKGEPVSISSLQLDDFHRGLLRSDDEDDLLHGLLSVVFWGFASGADRRLRLNRALARAKAIAHGRQNAPPQPREAVIRLLRRTRELLDAGPVEAAFLAALDIKFLQMAFASKLLMFIQPATAAVYDRVISRSLRDHRDAQLRDLGVSTALATSRAAREAQAQTYQRWCHWCSDKAAELNDAGLTWADWDGAHHAWRAVDVERALYTRGR
jgi:hypothetical protein